MTVAVLGAGGTIAPAIVRDLAESDEIDALLLLDRDRGRVEAVARLHGAGKATAAETDAGEPAMLARALDGVALLVNAASYRTNLAAMHACLAAGCAYIDLGGLFHVTERQLELGEAFAQRGLLALLGAGAGPGKTNVMAARAARELDEIEQVRCASAGLDPDPPAGLSTPYAVQTLLDELSLRPVVWRDGREQELEPLTDGGTISFPAPIGERESIYTLHSEVLTLPGSLGASACDFRLSLAPGVRAALLELLDRPRDALADMRAQPPSERTYSAQHVQVTGRRGGSPATVTITALTVPHERWGIGGGIVSTGSVAAAAARLWARGRLPHVGVLPPEACLEPELLFAELEPRGCSFELTVNEVAGERVG